MKGEWTKNDRKLFLERLPLWQEAYMNKLNREYIELLSSKEGEPSDRFWALVDRIKKDRQSPGVRCEVNRNDLVFLMRDLLYDKVITAAEIEGFSEEFRQAILRGAFDEA